MSNLDDVSDNKKPLGDRVAENKGDIDHLSKTIQSLDGRVQKLEGRDIGATTAIARISGHSSKMPDYKGENTDHDARYATKRDLKNITPPVSNHNDLNGLQGGSSTERYHLTAAQQSALHSPVTVADTDTVDMSISGQQISAETKGLTATITFVEGF